MAKTRWKTVDEVTNIRLLRITSSFYVSEDGHFHLRRRPRKGDLAPYPWCIIDQYHPDKELPRCPTLASARAWVKNWYLEDAALWDDEF